MYNFSLSYDCKIVNILHVILLEFPYIYSETQFNIHEIRLL